MVHSAHRADPASDGLIAGIGVGSTSVSVTRTFTDRRAGSHRETDPHPSKAFTLVLDLHDPHLADLSGGGNVGSSVGLLVEAIDVDDPNLVDLGRDQVLRGS